MKNFLKRNNGFTLGEVMVTSGLMGIVLLFGAKLFSNVNKSNKKVGDDLVFTIGKLQLSKRIQYDIENSRYSFNALSLLDDKDNTFFDYYFDSPCSNNCERVFSMTIDKKQGEVSRPFYMITSDRTYNKDITFSPVQGYNDNSLNFVSLNRNGFLASRKFSPWIKGKLLFLYSNLTVRKEGANPQTNPPRHISYLGWVKNTGKTAKLVQESIDDKGFIYFNNIDPRDDEEIVSEDIALKKLPFIKGLASEMYLTSVNIIRYQLKAEKVGGDLSVRLYRGVKKIGSGFIETIIGKDIKSLKFRRSNVSTAGIGVELDME